MRTLPFAVFNVELGENLESCVTVSLTSRRSREISSRLGQESWTLDLHCAVTMWEQCSGAMACTMRSSRLETFGLTFSTFTSSRTGWYAAEFPLMVGWAFPTSGGDIAYFFDYEFRTCGVRLAEDHEWPHVFGAARQLAEHQFRATQVALTFQKGPAQVGGSLIFSERASPC